MGQVQSPEPVQDSKPDVLCDVFSQGVVHASQRLREYLGFEDPQSKLQPSTDTLNEIFLVNFISFCMEKGVEEHITTSKMTKQQSLLFGVDWIWTIFGPDKNIRLQFTVQTCQLSDSAVNESGQSEQPCRNGNETATLDVLYTNKDRFEKLEEFCSLVGQDCVGLFIVFGLPGKPKEIRGALLDSVQTKKGKKSLPGDSLVKDYIMNTESFLSTREILEHCLSKKNRLEIVGNVYINFL
ncbi:Rab15 effector protein [Acipenser ruthenus]|uniref:Rab15 effector protein n=1 Tax=Acipenser ruthenus TaxID=7906 RepID=A0A444UDZ0_ACIRT|nr:rab15 effector protein-like [Acipenser ruthenus]RXM33392.1 Rab15 effector protein [Acipenser ruthenus]